MGSTSYLVGPAADQAKLYALMQILRDLNIELVSVNPVDDGATPGREWLSRPDPPGW